MKRNLGAEHSSDHGYQGLWVSSLKAGIPPEILSRRLLELLRPIHLGDLNMLSGGCLLVSWSRRRAGTGHFLQNLLLDEVELRLGVGVAVPHVPGQAAVLRPRDGLLGEGRVIFFLFSLVRNLSGPLGVFHHSDF